MRVGWSLASRIPVARQRMDRFAQRAAARNWLLDQQDRRLEPRDARVLTDPLPQFDHGVDVLELLVAIERDEIRLCDGIENCRDAGKALDVGVDAAADFELEIAVTVSRNCLLQTFRQSVVETFGGCVRPR